MNIWFILYHRPAGVDLADKFRPGSVVLRWQLLHSLPGLRAAVCHRSLSLLHLIARAFSVDLDGAGTVQWDSKMKLN